MNDEAVTLGDLNGHAVGIIMKEMVRRAIVAIRNQRSVFEVHTKASHSGSMDDVLTSADQAAQSIYLRSIRECFPHWGVIAEEDSLFVPCSGGTTLYFTVDPLDGTKAFVRRQSHGVGTMVSLCEGENTFVAAYVGDVNTQEIYGFRPGSQKAHRISEYSTNEVLSIATRPLSKQYIILRDPVRCYSQLSQNLINSTFKSHMIDGGGIGTWIARLWKGEVGGALICPSVETPWDMNPVNAILWKLGFVFFKPTADGTKWEPFLPRPVLKKHTNDQDILIVHNTNLYEIPDLLSHR